VDGDAADAGVEVRRSTVEGFGVFARRAFAAGELIRVVNVVREITADAPLRPEDGERAEHCAHDDGKVLLYGSPDRYYNHSCDPNAWVRYRSGRIEIVGRRMIPAGVEIRVDYLVNNSGGNSWPCNCGAARCRRMTGSSFFTLPPDQQLDYLPLLADWFVARHADAVAELRSRRPS
jgi:SET domain-containing protein